MEEQATERFSEGERLLLACVWLQIAVTGGGLAGALLVWLARQLGG